MSKSEFDCIGPGGLDTLLYDGPLLQVAITVPLALVRFLRENGQPPFSSIIGLGQIDTGAAVSAVDPSVFRELEIPSVDREMVQTAHGLSELDRYNASVRFLQLEVEPMPLHDVLGGHVRRPSVLGPDIIMLIGRDLLRSLVFTYDGPNARFTVAT
ncbi:Aspartyl protease [Bryocella elongata]|uniref:Aspartyl protease n=1 Tax=Bryocella elongata TaxID=863522 RepID=A0A1H6AZI2_9BACT|nr:hypothetical protein [Bryocella elongata]SEG53750.1 Aspartyl protease [Bryocella elongata]